MNPSALKNSGLMLKLFVMAGIALLTVLFLYLSSNTGFFRLIKNSEAVGTLNAVNQTLLEAIIAEKIFLKDCKDKSFQSVLDAVTSAIRKSDEFSNYPVFNEPEMRMLTTGLRHLLEKYKNSVTKLAEALNALVLKHTELSQVTHHFSDSTRKTVDLIAAYASLCELENKKADSRLMSLRDTGRDAEFATNQIFSVLNHHLFNQEDAETFLKEKDAALKKLKLQVRHAAIIGNYIEFVTDETAYFDYIRLLEKNFNCLTQATAEIHELWNRKRAFQNELDQIRKEILDTKKTVIGLANSEIGRLRKDVMRDNTLAFLLIFGILIFGNFLVGRSIVVSVGRVIASLREGAVQVASVSGDMASASQALASGAYRQTLSLEETFFSIEEISSMTRQNADYALEAKRLMTEAEKVIDETHTAMNELKATMAEIYRSGSEIQKLIRLIEGIAFQTNMLALNIMIQAAHAGKNGAGFAVIAEEVGRLSACVSDVAKDTEEMIAHSVRQIDKGSNVLIKTNAFFIQAAESAKKAGILVRDITSASQEQSHRIEQIHIGIVELGGVAQQTMSCSEQTASLSEELYSHAEQMRIFVYELVKVVGGKGASATLGRTQASVRQKHSASQKLSLEKVLKNAAGAA